jgi:hypothetical protein
LLLEHLPSSYRPFLPSWRSPLYLHLRPHWRALERTLSSCEGRVLDVGCGMQPYRHMLGPRVVEYVGVDRVGELTRPTIVGTAEALPVPDASSRRTVASCSPFPACGRRTRRRTTIGGSRVSVSNG